MSTKPCASRATPQPSSQSVSGSAPTNRNTWRIGRCSSTPVRLSRQVTARSPPGRSPCSCVSSVWACSSMFGVRIDAVDQVARHAWRRGRVLAPANGPLQTCCGQKDGGLAGRVAAADQRRLRLPVHIFASSAEAQYQTPRPSNSREARHVGPAIARAAGDHDRARSEACVRR